MTTNDSPGVRHEDGEAMANAFADLRDHLARKARELNDEVRRYPTPIARCDEQLPKLLEQRARAVGQSQLAEKVGAQMNDSGSDRLQCLAHFVLVSESADDDVEQALRARLADAMSRSSPV